MSFQDLPEARKLLQEGVVDFLCGRGQLVVSDEHDQVQAAKFIAHVLRQTCLPKVPVSFDDKGTLSLGLSDDDFTDIQNLVRKRWPDVAEALQKGDEVSALVPQPDWSCYIGDEDPGRMDMGRLFDMENRYALDVRFWLEAALTATKILEPKRKEWCRENLQYDFPSLAGNSRFYYDACRTMYETPEAG